MRTAVYVDVGLLTVILLLFAPRGTGLPVHEWLGVAVAALIVVHLLLSWPWISTGTRGFSGRSDRRARVNYLLNWTLFVLIFVEITSGIAISRAVLPRLGIHTVNDRSWRALHNQTLNWTLLVLGIHVAMNWQPLVVGVRRHLLRQESARG